MIVNQIGTGRSSADNAEIGDIKITARTDLGDKWLLCNGADINASNYPELSECFPGLAGVWKTKDIDNSSILKNFTINDAIYADGYWVVVGSYYDGSSYYARLAYTNKIDGNWTTRDLWSGYGGTGISAITYDNGYWIVSGVNNGSYYYAHISCATDLSGTWKTQSVGASGYYGMSISAPIYLNGYWCVTYTRYNSVGSSVNILSTTNPTGIWDNRIDKAGNSSYISNVVYAEGYYAMCVSTSDDYGKTTRLYYGSTPQSLNYIDLPTYCDECSVQYGNGYWVIAGKYSKNVYIMYSTSITGNWTSQTLWTATSNYLGDTSLIYADNRWVVSNVYQTGSQSYYRKIAYATSPNQSWSTKDILSNMTLSGFSLLYDHGYWVTYDHYYNGSTYYERLSYTKNITGEWNIEYLCSSTTTNGMSLIKFKSVNGYFIISILDNSDTSAPIVKIFIKNPNAFALPTISVDNAYAYIKAKN